MRKLTHQEIVARQQELQKRPRLGLVVVLNNIRSLYNVGSIFRTADGAGVKKIWLCGITGYPPNSQIDKTALGAQETVEWAYAQNAYDVIASLKADGFHIVMLEQLDQSIPYYQYQPQGPVCLVLGHEVEGVSSSLLPLCDQAIEIEMAGLKNSLNVSVAFGIVAFHLKNVL